MLVISSIFLIFRKVERFQNNQRLINKDKKSVTMIQASINTKESVRDIKLT
jgi:hypothetical protein